jgi:spore germination cell wall hydrolase CwlJ-like protein
MTDLSSIFASQLRKPTMAELLMKQGVSTAPAQGGWGEGLARALMGGMAGYLEKQDANDAGNDFDKMYGKPSAPQPVASAPASPDPKALGAALAQPSMASMIANNHADGPPLPAPTGNDRDLMIRTIHAEAGNQGPEGMRGVASVIRNRSISGDYGGSNVSDVIRAPNQFEPVNTPAGQQRMASLPVGSNQYNNIGRTIDEAYAGNDPTNGATQFFAPKAQAALGRPVPAWAQGQGQDIGDHRFFGGQQTAQADHAALPPNSTPTQGFAIPGQPSQPQGSMQRQAPQIPPETLANARALFQKGDPVSQARAAAMLEPYTKPKDQERPLTDPADRARYGIAPTDQRPYQVNSTTNKASPIDTSPTITMQANTTGETEYSKGKAADALGLERSADKTMMERQKLEVFKSLVSDFKTGKLAPAQSTMGAWGDAIGVSPETMSKLGIPPNAAVNGQLIESLSNELTLGMIGTKGGEGGAMPANNFSDADRKFLQNTVPGLARMQGGNMVLAEIKQRSLDRQLDKISMWDEYRSQGKKFEDFERDWRAKVRSEPSLFADVPDMVRGLSNQPNASGFAPAGNAPQNAQPAPSALPNGWSVKVR